MTQQLSTEALRALMPYAETIGGTVAFLNLPGGAATSTVSSSTVFLRGAREGVVTATGRLVHKGRTTIVVETELTGADGRPLTRTVQTQAVLLPPEHASTRVEREG